MAISSREAEPVRQAWRYQRRPKPNHADVKLLPPPETLTALARKFWIDQKYGIWINGSAPETTDKGEVVEVDPRYHTLHSRELDLLKSYIAKRLIDEDRSRFNIPETPEKFRLIYLETVENSQLRVNTREAELELYLQEKLQDVRARIAFKQIRGTLSEAADLFVGDILNPNNEKTGVWRGPDILASMFDRVGGLNINIPV